MSILIEEMFIFQKKIALKIFYLFGQGGQSVKKSADVKCTMPLLRSLEVGRLNLNLNKDRPLQTRSVKIRFEDIFLCLYHFVNTC